MRLTLPDSLRNRYWTSVNNRVSSPPALLSHGLRQSGIKYKLLYSWIRISLFVLFAFTSLMAQRTAQTLAHSQNAEIEAEMFFFIVSHSQ